MHDQHSLLHRYRRRAPRAQRLRVYNEAVFRYLLAVEGERCRRAGRPLVLVLVDAEAAVDVSASLNRRLARKMFAGLSRCLRETDLIGWYLDHHVAGAVLTEVANEAASDVAERVVRRISHALRAAVPRSLASRLRVRLSLNPDLVPGGVAC